MPYGPTKLLAALFLFLGWRIGRNYGKCFSHSETLISHVHLKLHLVKNTWLLLRVSTVAV